ncbi:MAG TPA: hypothetical protein ENH54_00705 [Actinobacteria bacterium]|nr:hypothetical protein [Actinomycetota bacterium]
MTSNRTSVGIVGASGYMGGEALRVLLEHPQVELAWATSRRPGAGRGSTPELLRPGHAVRRY